MLMDVDLHGYEAMVFGLIFAAFANIGKTHLVFMCNAVSQAYL